MINLDLRAELDALALDLVTMAPRQHHGLARDLRDHAAALLRVRDEQRAAILLRVGRACLDRLRSDRGGS